VIRFLTSEGAYGAHHKLRATGPDVVENASMIRVRESSTARHKDSSKRALIPSRDPARIEPELDQLDFAPVKPVGHVVFRIRRNDDSGHRKFDASHHRESQHHDRLRLR
jgi:hypothetical protein